MSVFLPQKHHWLANGWISRAFFRDALKVMPPDSKLAHEFEELVNDDSKTLDMEDRPQDVIEELRVVVDSVIAYNERLGGSHFGQPEFFPVYLGHLGKLKELVEGVLSRDQFTGT